jgi:hypothetical protein
VKQRIAGALLVPGGGGDPPALPISESFDAVDATGDDGAVGFEATLVGAEDVGDVAEAPGVAVKFPSRRNR